MVKDGGAWQLKNCNSVVAFKSHNTVLVTLTPALDVRSPELIHLPTARLHFLANVQSGLPDSQNLEKIPNVHHCVNRYMHCGISI